MHNVLTTSRNSAQSDQLFAFTQGISLDKRLAQQEIRVQKGWVTALAKIGLLSKNEALDLGLALDEALKLMQTGKFSWRIQDEDIHMNLERFITERLGVLGKKMHLGRSRNDLIATSLRLYVHDSLEVIQGQLTRLIQNLISRAQLDIDVLMPGMTHLQHGQPIRYSQVLAAHGWGFWRDLERVLHAKANAVASMPLGSAALSGTTLPINLTELAAELGFASPSLNAYDSVGDRDFIVEGLDVLSGVALHLSRLAEDVTLWASTGLGLVKLPKQWSTGSSIMPNKRNPDLLELTRARAAKIIGFSNSGRTLMKALPSSYSSDLHELKGVFMQAFEELANCLNIVPELVAELKPNPKRAQELLKHGHILATDIAENLTLKGVPFREAYKQVAALVEAADDLGVELTGLSAEQVAKLAPNLDYAFLATLTPETAVERRTGSGGTAKLRVLEGLAALEQRLQRQWGVSNSGNGNGAAHATAAHDQHGFTVSEANTCGASGRLWELSEWV